MDTGTTHTGTPLNAGLARAIEAAGSQTALAKAIGRSQATVWEWTQTGRVAAQDAVAIEKATGIPAEQISPTIREYAKVRRIKVREAA